MSENVMWSHLGCNVSGLFLGNSGGMVVFMSDGSCFYLFGRSDLSFFAVIFNKITPVFNNKWNETAFKILKRQKSYGFMPVVRDFLLIFAP